MSPATTATTITRTSTAKVHRTNAHFVEATAEVFVHLAPCFAGDVMRGVHEKLDRFLLKYVPSLRGVVLSYDRVRALQEKGRIMYDSPFVHFRVAASFVLFAPVVGSTIVGVVNKQSSDHIGLLVYGIFNASIPSAAIRDAFSWHEQEQAWVLDATGEVVDHGCAMRLVVDKAVVEQEVLGLSGSLLDAKLTGFCGGEDDTDVGSMKHGGHAGHAEHRAHAEHQKHEAPPTTPSSTISPAKKRKNESAADASISSSSSKKSKKKDAAKESIDETTAVADAVDAAVLNVKATAAVKESKEKKARKEKRKSAVSVAE